MGQVPEPRGARPHRPVPATIRAAVIAAGVLAVSVMAWAAPAAAHDPVILTPDQRDPASGPGLPDGTISFALYGVIDTPEDTAGFSVTFAEGDRLTLTLLIPDQLPERGRADDELPVVDLVAPDGTERRLTPDRRVTFDEAFSGTRYVRLLEVDEPAQVGTYGVTVRALAPTRFTVAVGTEERFGTPVDNAPNRSEPGGGVDGVQAWFDTPPPAVAGQAASPTVPQEAASPGASPTLPEEVLPEEVLPEEAGSAAAAPRRSSDGSLVPMLLFSGAGLVAIGVGVWWSLRRR